VTTLLINLRLYLFIIIIIIIIIEHYLQVAQARDVWQPLQPNQSINQSIETIETIV